MLALVVVLSLAQTVAASHARASCSVVTGGRPGLGTSRCRRCGAGRPDRGWYILETSPLFAVVVLAAHVTGTYNALTEWVARLCL
jgi:uncharacterized MAPEG superfamily protein